MNLAASLHRPSPSPFHASVELDTQVAHRTRIIASKPRMFLVSDSQPKLALKPFLSASMQLGVALDGVPQQLRLNAFPRNNSCISRFPTLFFLLERQLGLCRRASWSSREIRVCFDSATGSTLHEVLLRLRLEV